ncbi:DUF1638 domain-containing protein [Desulfosarcina ovata]|uniref:DUF1638 domain-containing protein n=2 Tax=Desulfosarcina ovata TaxID=83564 RepID=A0A5K8AB52_9BACT|nr:DUF1638 domain-containing protein [Desulfosarcina ovata]BBO83413.1 hypothetical protein DSCO28_39790 [Desulfosarcina ovata subsp. sediminis]BBO89761.1 hypothetical protein DSCOOX_29410 [Desulfosarcina ovata subsp. ovata]
MAEARFNDISIVSCGTMSLELNFLKKEGFLDTPQILYTRPGLHQDTPELERQLVRQIEQAKQKTPYVLVVYGGKFCYVNIDQPTRLMQTIITEQGPSVARIEATHCMDMIASEAEREQIAAEAAGGEPVWWMTPGWIKFRKDVFKGWDKGLANENFPKHTGGAIVLDGVGYMDDFMAENPETFLEYSDWMGIPIIPWPVSLDRFKRLLLDQAEILHAR